MDQKFTHLDPNDSRVKLAAESIERLRTKLLDLTGRNPLLNYRHSDRARPQVRVIDELPDIIYSRLDDEKELSFRALDEPPDEPSDEKTDDFQMTLEAARLEDPEYLEEIKKIEGDDSNNPAFFRLERGLKDRVRIKLALTPRPTRATISPADCARLQGLNPSYDLPRLDGTLEEKHYDNEIQTLLFPDRMEAKLSALRYGARKAIEEQGINTLFLAYGFLEWYEAPQSEKPLYAPLLLQPLEIERVSHRGHWRYYVRATGEETTYNITLAERLKQDFGLDLPKFGEEDTPESYFLNLEQLTSKQKNWRVRRFLTFGLFSFGRLVMWHDLASNRWPTKAGPSTNSLVATLLAGGGGGENVHADDYLLDEPEWAEKLPPLILNADSSQISAILDAMAGKNLAIKGPPGTGKSQTITNLIAAAIFEGKRVLFIAEKMAALDVVKSRLDHAGLGFFVLELHSTKAKKKEVLENLSRRLEQQKKIRPPARIAEERWELERLKRNLTQYVHLLNTPFGRTGRTVQEILWSVQRARKDNLPESLDRVVLDHVTEMTLKDFERGQHALGSLESAWNQISNRWQSPALHPWAWVETVLSPFEHEELISATQAWRTQVEDLISVANEANNIPFNVNLKEPTIARLETVRHIMIKIPSEPPKISNARLLVALQDSGPRRHIRAYYDLQARRDVLQQRCLSVIPTIPGSSRHKEIADLPELISYLDVGERRMAELQDIRSEAEKAYAEWKAIQRASDEINSALRIESCDSQRDLKLALETVALVATTPTSVLAHRHPKLAENEAATVLRWAVDYCVELSDRHRHLETQFDIRQAGEPGQLRRSAFILRKSNFLKRFASSYKRAKRKWQDLTLEPRKLSRQGMADELEYLSAHVEEVSAFVKHQQLNNLLDHHFEGLNTDFKTLLLTSEFLISARKLTIGTDQLRTGLRTLLVEGRLDDIKQISDLGNSETVSMLQRGLELLSARKMESLGDVGVHLDQCLQATSQLSQAIHEFRFLPNIRLKTLEQLTEDLAELAHVEAEIGTLSMVEQIIRTAELDPAADVDIINATISFADELSAALSVEQPDLTQYLFSKDVRERLVGLKALSVSIELKMEAEVSARETTLKLAVSNGGSFTAGISNLPLAALLGQLDNALGVAEELSAWNNFIRSKTDVVNELLWTVVEAYGEAALTNVRNAFIRVFWRSLARKAFEEHPELKTLSGLTQERARSQFRRADQTIMDLNRQELAAKLCCMTPPIGNDTGPKGEWTELSLIRHQTQLQRPRIAIRDLLRRAGHAIQALKPCWMMSPISVAQFLEPGIVDFDMIVIDEASQVRPEEAIGAIARGCQVVVVGDPMQLPPTSFFERVDAFDDEEEQDLEEESVLDMALSAFYPYRHLIWHYRSRHQSLIAFSNKQFYDNRLIVFPSPSNDGRFGVKYHKVNGVYQGRGGNPQEVRAVAEAAVEFMRLHPDWSLGVVAVNLQQAELLRLEIDRLLLRDEQAQEYIQTWEATLEPFFVKNLENVQGDERDCIMISTVYGPNQAGQVMQRFGPINQKTGHRRLNVLFTRAKYRVDLFTSLTSTDVREDEYASYGVKTLKIYLEYAATGRLESGVITGKEPDSDFEVFVAEALRLKGYQVEPQVGVAGFYIDMAVTHPTYTHGYLAGIECDGATYHSAKSARDRDALRQEILEGLGWKLYRIWSVDWFNNPNAEIEKLAKFLEELLH